MKRQFIFLKDLCTNMFFSHKYDLFFVIENHDWVIDTEWSNVSVKLNSRGPLKSRTTSTAIGLRNKIIHFGSVGTFITKHGCKSVHHSNRVVLSWFHVVLNDERLKFVKEINKKVDFIHTACDITRQKLINSGVDISRIVLVPLGVDLSVFKKGVEADMRNFRNSLGINPQSVVIGSFQKDGNGWGGGDTPKLIKGPDIFCNVVEKLSQKYPIHVLLTGPSRGYVINRLKKANIKYTHVYVDRPEDVVLYYQILDLYLICSREEGGPKALLESMACGVPLVSTRVGMCPELIKNGENGYLVGVDDEGGLFLNSRKLLEDIGIRNSIILQGLESIKKYDYDLVRKMYLDDLYSKIRPTL